MKRCPYCAEDIQPDAIKCRFCGSMLQESAAPTRGGCKYCQAPVAAGARSCANCGARFRAGGLGPIPRLALAFLFAAAGLLGLLVLVQQAISAKSDPEVAARRNIESLMESVERDVAAGRGTEKWRRQVKALMEVLRRRPTTATPRGRVAPDGGARRDGGATGPADEGGGAPSRFEPRPGPRPPKEGGKSAG